MRSPYHTGVEYEKKVPHRSYCSLCYHPLTINFWVPDEIWFEAIPKAFNNSVVCVNCMIRLADDKFLPWDKEIKLLPVSAFRQRQIQQDVERGIFDNPETEHVWHVARCLPEKENKKGVN